MKRSVTKKEDREARLVRATDITIDSKGQTQHKGKFAEGVVADAQVYDELESTFEQVNQILGGSTPFHGV